MVFACYKEHPYNRITPREFIEALDVGLGDLNYHAVYLEEKGLLELQKPLEGSVFVGARITPRGIDLCEDEYRFEATFPAGTQISVPENIFLALDGVIAAVTQRHDMNPDDAEIIADSIASIRAELQEDTPQFSTIKQHLEKIRKRHPDTAQDVTNILKSPSIMRILKESLWK
jgi:hypothetical protein